jgi:hypothetical protein
MVKPNKRLFVAQNVLQHLTVRARNRLLRCARGVVGARSLEQLYAMTRWNGFTRVAAPARRDVSVLKDLEGPLAVFVDGMGFSMFRVTGGVLSAVLKLPWLVRELLRRDGKPSEDAVRELERIARACGRALGEVLGSQLSALFGEKEFSVYITMPEPATAPQAASHPPAAAPASASLKDGTRKRRADISDKALASADLRAKVGGALRALVAVRYAVLDGAVSALRCRVVIMRAVNQFGQAHGGDDDAPLDLPS